MKKRNLQVNLAKRILQQILLENETLIVKIWPVRRQTFNLLQKTKAIPLKLHKLTLIEYSFPLSKTNTTFKQSEIFSSHFHFGKHGHLFT